ncbi:MAG: hypothetical protein HVN35_09000 [Methanobacteriaceae archaeon]|nr:hypothetical protein [Methanobacteriaceae archaeon]
MGELQKKLDKIQKEFETSYAEIMAFLEDRYCWKCPMRTSRTQSRCGEVHAGRVLQESVEEGTHSHLKNLKIPEAEIEALLLRIMKKKIKRQGGKQRENTFIFKVHSKQSPDLRPGTYLQVKINPRRLKPGEEILISPEPLENPVLGSVALITGFPFIIVPVQKFFHEGNFWYVEVENNRIIPLESVFAVLLKNLKQGNSLLD